MKTYPSLSMMFAPLTFTIALLAASIVGNFQTADAALTSGEAIAVDLSTAGGSAASFNPFNSNTTIGAGSVIRHSDSAIVPGVSVTVSGAGGFNNDGAANAWPGTGGDPYYVGAADDITFGAGSTVTFNGLTNDVQYNLRVYSLIGNNPATVDPHNVTSFVGLEATPLTRGSRWAAGTLESAGTVFTNLSPTSAGAISINNTFMNAVVLEAVPLTEIENGTVIGIDIGPTPSTDWNNFAADGTIAAGNVTDTQGQYLKDISLTMSRTGGGGYNNDGTNSWMEVPAGSLPDVPDSATTDITFAGGNGASLDLTIDGLDPLLLYNIDAITTAGNNRTDVVTITGGDGVFVSSLLRPDSASGEYHSFQMISPDGSGTILLSVTDTSGGNNPILNAVRIEAIQAVPEPSSYVLGLFGAMAIGMLVYRKRRRA